MLPRLNGTSRLDKLGRVDMLCPTSKCRFVPFPSKIVDTALDTALGGGGAYETTVVEAATALAPALALRLASAEASTRAYAQGWQPAVAD
jgi:hypothetical protein